MNYKKIPQLSERLKYIRAHFDLSQVELAEKAGTTQQAIQQAEKGKARQPRYLHQLARTLDISVDWLIFGSIDEEVKKSDISEARGLKDKSSDVLDSFFAMPEKDQKIMLELMQARKEK